MAKYYKLGEKANFFYDPTTKVKILPGVIVKVEDEDNRSRTINEARRNNHIVEQTEDQYNDYLEEQGIEVEEKPFDFKALTSKEMKAYLIDNYELSEEEVKEINGLKKDELIAKYNEFEK